MVKGSLKETKNKELWNSSSHFIKKKRVQEYRKAGKGLINCSQSANLYL